MDEITQLIVNNIGAITMAGGFIWYLDRMDKRDQQKNEEFARIISNHLDHTNETQKETNEANLKLASQLQHLADVVHSLDNRLSKKKSV